MNAGTMERFMSQSLRISSAKIVFNPKDQHLDAVHRVLAGVLGRGGCGTCGRLAVLEVQLASDPEPDAGIISYTVE
jgi:hypothetical protein